jgi:hypothetical protein
MRIISFLIMSIVFCTVTAAAALIFERGATSEFSNERIITALFQSGSPGAAAIAAAKQELGYTIVVVAAVKNRSTTNSSSEGGASAFSPGGEVVSGQPLCTPKTTFLDLRVYEGSGIHPYGFLSEPIASILRTTGR